jgi:predicted MFS family arabinose efflux permease
MVALRGAARGGKHSRIDAVGAILCVFGLAGPVFALIEGPTRGYSDPLIVFSFVGGLVVFGLFIVWELHTRTPMLPLSLFRLRNFTFANLETLSVYAGLSTLTFFLVLFLQQVAGYSPLRSGLATLPITVVMFFLSGRFGRLSMRLGPRWFMGIGPLICAAACLWMRELSPGFYYWTELLPPIVVFAFGLSMIVAPLTSTVLADAGPSDAGIASGVNNAIARIAGLLGIAVVGAAVASNGTNLDEAGFQTAMVLTAALVAAGGVTGLIGITNRGAHRK